MIINKIVSLNYYELFMCLKKLSKSVIRNKLGIVGTKVFARKCTVKEIPTEEARTFIDTYHLYGYKKAKVKLGLYIDNELIQVMTFSTGNHSRKQNGWEIDRFATKFDYQVVGGASKLFKHFIRSYNPISGSPLPVIPVV